MNRLTENIGACAEPERLEVQEYRDWLEGRAACDKFFSSENRWIRLILL